MPTGKRERGMGKFNINREHNKRHERDGHALYRFEHDEIRVAFIKAREDHNLSGQKLLGQMVRHCLREAGYLKDLPSENKPEKSGLRGS